MSARQDYPTARELTLALGGKWNDISRQGKCRCPAHDDANPSMEVTIGRNGKPVFCCQSQKCPQTAILAALKKRGLWPEPDSEANVSNKKNGRLGPVVAKYPYRNEHGDVLFWVYRHEPKTFRQHRPDGKPGIEGIRRVIYRLDEVTEAIAADKPIFIPEGEKDVDNLWANGVPATCNPMGAGKWCAEYSQLLAGADIVILPDNDDSGRAHAAEVAASLAGIARRIRVVTLPDLREKGDVSSWLEAGGTLEIFWTLVEHAPDWAPQAADEPEPPDMSIVNRNRVAATPFPVETLRSASTWVAATAASKNASPDFVALGLLVVATSTIGPKRRVTPWDGWSEPSILWGALVGPPGSNKSPAIDPLLAAVRAIERSLNLDWADREARYQTAKQTAETLRSMWEQRVKEALKAELKPPQMPTGAIEPKSPTKDTIWVGNITSEQVARKLAVNSGLISFRDELSGLLGGFDKYGGAGGDRSFWLECYGGRPYRYDRVSLKEPLDIEFCSVSLLGGIQPDKLHSMLMSGDDDGLPARVVFAWPDAVQRKRPTDQVDDSKLHSALGRLWDMTFPMLEDGARAPIFVPLEPEAADEFQSWWEARGWGVAFAESPLVASAMAKLDGLTLRIAQTLEFLEWAWIGSNAPEPAQVGMKSLVMSMRVIDEWVVPNLMRVYGEAALPQDQRNAIAVARWLLKHKPATINAKRLRLTPGFQGPKDAKEMDAALEVLVDARWLTPAGTRQGDTKGRASKDFAVNPDVYAEAQK